MNDLDYELIKLTIIDQVNIHTKEIRKKLLAGFSNENLKETIKEVVKSEMGIYFEENFFPWLQKHLDEHDENTQIMLTHNKIVEKFVESIHKKICN